MHDPHALIGHSVQAIDTPALVVDLDAMERNLQRMQTYATEHGVRLRPHAKMHKSATLALLQMQAGAVGVCVQKASEAAALVAAGVTNVYVSNEVVSLSKCELLAQLNKGLAAKNGHISVAVDSLLGIERLAHAMRTHGTDAHVASRMEVYVEIDVGQGRCGIPPGDAALPLVKAIAQHANLHFAGLQAYHGRAQHLRSALDRREAIAHVVADVQRTKAAIEAAGFVVPLVTGAGTGTFSHEATSGVYGELQAGSYLFMDTDYAANEADPRQPQFEHALFVKSQVMSRHAAAHDDRAVVDAGHKSHAIDSGLPRVWGGHGTNWTYSNGGDEHGILHGTALPELGATVWLVPGHCDPTVNLHSHMVGVRGGLALGVVEQIIRVDARGALT
jgi:D-serine deaminase-like pyridoxal phosphate-dependent protein